MRLSVVALAGALLLPALAGAADTPGGPAPGDAARGRALVADRSGAAALFTELQPAPMEHVDVLGGGRAALEAANTLLAQALAPDVRVVGVAPGLTLTSHLLTPEKFEALHKLSPLGRSSSAQDVAATVKFALDNASITGTTLLVDGGQHLMRFERDFSMM